MRGAHRLVPYLGGVMLLLLSGCAAGGGLALPPPPPTIPAMTASAHEAALTETKMATALKLDSSGKYAEAAQAYRVAATAGNPLAMEMLGEMYDSGDGLRHDAAAAAQQFQLAALAGYAPAATRLGDKYSNGNGVPRNQDLAFAWYRLAAAQGEDTATSRLAQAMLKGDGVPRDVEGAIKLLQQCAAPDKASPAYHPSGESGGPGCQAMLGAVYLEGDGGVPVDLKQGADWMHRAALQGMPVAERHLAELYEQGKGVKQDSGEATYWRGRAEAHADREPGYWTPL